jgi:hypothetical protein
MNRQRGSKSTETLRSDVLDSNLLTVVESLNSIGPESDRESRYRFDLILSQQLLFWLEDRLDSPDREQFLAVRTGLTRDASRTTPSLLAEIIGKLPTDASRRVKVVLDELTLQQGRTFGARIFLCREIQQRVLQWEREDNGPRLYERLGEELALFVRIRRGEKKTPLDPMMRSFKNDVKKEYSLLQNALRSHDSGRRPLPFVDLLSFAESHIKTNVRAFPRLATNLLAFCRLTRENNGWLTQRNLTPGAFADELLGSQTNRAPESVRQEISRMSHRKL